VLEFCTALEVSGVCPSPTQFTSVTTEKAESEVRDGFQRRQDRDFAGLACGPSSRAYLVDCDVVALWVTATTHPQSAADSIAAGDWLGVAPGRAETGA
jgi:hypothetical protein